MTTETKEVKPVIKKTYLPESQVRASIAKSINFVLTCGLLNNENLHYIKRMEEKHAKNKPLTSNEVAGLAKIERALQHVLKGTYQKTA